MARPTVFRLVLPWLLAVLGLFGAAPTIAQVAPVAQDAPADDPDARAAEIAARIRALQAEIEALLRDLPPEVRREVDRRLTDASLPAPVAPEEPAAPRVVETPSQEAATPPTTTAATPTGCRPLAPFDTDGDGRVTARDRYWRYLHVLPQGSADRASAEDVYAAGVRGVDTDLSGFELEDGGRGRVSVSGFITLDFDEPGRSPGRLAVDASRLARGAGPELLPEDDDTPLTGLQPLEPGQRLRYDDGRVETLAGCF